MFKLYKVVGSSETLIESGVGKTEFNDLDANCEKYDWDECDFLNDYHKDFWDDNLSYWYCDYKVSMEKITGTNCKKKYKLQSSAMFE